jgi:hypothetical protein
MPWCPQCGAEYHEGLTSCAKCQAALVDERPPRSLRRHWRESLPPVVQTLLRRVTAAGVCALEALRLFRRHPSLLLLPALIAFANVAVREATHFAYGRESSPGGRTTLTGPTWVPVSPSSWAREQLLTISTVSEFARPISTPSLTPVVGAWWVTRHSPILHGAAPSVTRPLMAAFLLVSLLDIALAALILAGYYGVACALVSAGDSAQNSFRANVRRHWVRFLQVGVIIAIVLGWLPLLQFFLSGSELNSRAGNIWVMQVGPVASFFFALPLYILVSDGGSALAAIKRSVFMVATHLAEMVPLLAGFVLARALVLWPLLVLSEQFDLGQVQRAPLQSGSVLWGASLTSAFVTYIWTTVLGVWLCLTMFFWYRAVTGRPLAATIAAPSVE